MEIEDTRSFKSLEIEGWRQFGQVSIDFDQRLTILTGANASGKTTILSLLAKHFEWQRSFSATPTRGKKGGSKWSILTIDPALFPERGQRVGRLEYSNGHQTDLQAPEDEPDRSAQYNVNWASRQEVTGVYLTSHRAVAGNYAQVQTIPALFGSSEEIFNQFTNIVRTRWTGSWGGKTPQLALKEALIAAAVFGEGGESVERNAEAWDIWLGFQQLLGDIFPQSLGYEGIRIRDAEVIVETAGGDFVLDEVSGGLSALIEMAWQIFLLSRHKEQFTVLIDEPENHLHPSLQRGLLPSLLRAFPQLQFIVATHSPFAVTASPDSSVYVLDYGDEEKVFSRRLDYVNKAASADETLRRVLGLESTMPAWAERRFAAILEEHLRGEVSDARLADLREALKSNGLASEFPMALLAASEKAVEKPREN